MEIGKKMATLDSLYDTLSSIVGDAGILPDDQVTGYTVDDILPKVVIVPADKSEMQDVLRIASERNVSVIPAGSGSKLSIGNVVPEIGIVMSTKRLNKVIEYEPADLTVTVESGIRLSDLQKELAVHRQYLPLNPPYADNCTIGRDCSDKFQRSTSVAEWNGKKLGSGSACDACKWHCRQEWW